MYSTISDEIQTACWNACLELEKLTLGDDAQAQIDIIKEAVKEPPNREYRTAENSQHWHG
jgi:hypothetical protein